MPIYRDICTEEDFRLCEQKNIVALSECLNDARAGGDPFLLSSRDSVFDVADHLYGDRDTQNSTTQVGKSLSLAEKQVYQYGNGKVCRFTTLTSELSPAVRAILKHDIGSPVSESLRERPIRLIHSSLADGWLDYLMSYWDSCPKFVNVAVHFEIDICEMMYLLRGDCDDLTFSPNGETFGLNPWKGTMISDAKILLERASDLSKYNANLIREFFAQCATSMPE